MGKLRIGDIEKDINPIILYSWFSEIKIETEFTFTIDVFNPDDDDNPLVLSFGPLKKPYITSLDDLKSAELHFEHAEINNSENIIYVDDEEYEAMDLSIKITKLPLGYNISGKSIIQNVETDEKLKISFDAYAKLNKTERIEYNFSNYGFQKKNMVQLLEQISNEDRLLNYKRAVPFVHIPLELMSQWKSAYGVEFKWFYEMYDDFQIEQLHEINNQFHSLYSSLNANDEIPDVPDILENMHWIKLMRKCQATLAHMK